MKVIMDTENDEAEENMMDVDQAEGYHDNINNEHHDYDYGYDYDYDYDYDYIDDLENDYDYDEEYQYQHNDSNEIQHNLNGHTNSRLLICHSSGDDQDDDDDDDVDDLNNYQSNCLDLHEEAQGHGRKSLWLHGAGDFDLAIDEWKKCLVIHESFNIRYSLGGMFVYSGLGYSYIRKDYIDDAITAFHTELRIKAYLHGHVNKDYWLTESLKKKGLCDYEIEQHKSALITSTVLEKEGDVYRTKGDFLYAIEKYKTAIEFEKDVIGKTITLPFLFRKIVHIVFLSYILGEDVLRSKIKLIDWKCIDCINSRTNKEVYAICIDHIFQSMKRTSAFGCPEALLKFVQLENIIKTIRIGDGYHDQYSHDKALEYYQKVLNTQYDEKKIKIGEFNYKKSVEKYSMKVGAPPLMGAHSDTIGPQDLLRKIK